MTSGYNRHLGNYPYIAHGNMGEWTFESIEIKQRIVSRLNRPPDKPCNPLNDENVHLCLRNYTLQEVGCAPPWETEALKTMRLCDTREDYKRFTKITRVFGSNEALLDNVVKMTGCQVNCRTTKYKATRLWNMQQNYFNYHKWSCKAKYIFSLALTEQETEVQAEVVTYDENNFIADTGGFLGLLLGISAMDIANIFEKLAQCINTKHLERANTST